MPSLNGSRNPISPAEVISLSLSSLDLLKLSRYLYARARTLTPLSPIFSLAASMSDLLSPLRRQRGRIASIAPFAEITILPLSKLSQTCDMYFSLGSNAYSLTSFQDFISEGAPHFSPTS